MRRSRLAGVVLGAVLVVGAAGCGDDDGPGAVGTDDGGGPGSGTIQVGETSLGDVLTDGDGMTLYMFDQDTDGTSVCEGDCLAVWPALEGEPEAGDGAEADLIGTIERSDGTTQATYAGHPLYYYAEDGTAGDVNGQGVEDVWWVLDAAGTAVSVAPTEEESDSGGRDGY